MMNKKVHVHLTEVYFELFALRHLPVMLRQLELRKPRVTLNVKIATFNSKTFNGAAF